MSLCTVDSEVLRTDIVFSLTVTPARQYSTSFQRQYYGVRGFMLPYRYP